MKEWFTTTELSGLAGLPKNRTAMIRYVDEKGWKTWKDGLGTPLARKRGGRGGGTEYH